MKIKLNLIFITVFVAIDMNMRKMVVQESELGEDSVYSFYSFISVAEKEPNTTI